MIKDKHSVRQPHQPAPVQESLPEEVSENPFVNMYQAVKRAIQTIREDPDDPLSPPFFKTIAIDNGQFARIVRGENTEYETLFSGRLYPFRQREVPGATAENRRRTRHHACTLHS